MFRSFALILGALFAAACGSGFGVVDGGADAGGAEAGEGGSDDAMAGEAGGMSFLCGSTPCSALTQTCCISNQGGTPSCMTGPNCPASNDYMLHCLSRRDCLGNEVCCFHDVNQGGLSVCALACDMNGLPLCDPMVDTDCAAMQQCTTNPNGGINLPPGVGGCQGN